MKGFFVLLGSLGIFAVVSWAQTSQDSTVAITPQSKPVVTLQDALQRARNNDVQFRAAVTDAAVSSEDRVQSRAALLPGVNYTTGAIYTQPTRASNSPRYIASNGVHEYISQGSVQESISFSSVADYRRAHASEALAKARLEIASRGLTVAVTQSYYDAVITQRKRENAEQAVAETQRFLTISQLREKGGEVANSDVIKAELQANDRSRDLQEAKLAEEKAHLGLAVLIFPAFTQEFELVDDLQSAVSLPNFHEVESLAAKNNAELKAALAAMQVAGDELHVAVGGHLPTLTLDYIYGIDASNYAVKTDGVRNLGYQVSATLQLPIFNWGATQSKVKQAQLKRDQARVELSAAQRQALANLNTFYSEANVSKEQIAILHQSVELAAESLRLTMLRYQAGEATALEVVDAQNALIQSRNGFDDGNVRYRVALANLQTLTGSF